MLILTRKPGEAIVVGDDIRINVVSVKGNQIALGITAPKEIPVHREEVHMQIVNERIKELLNKQSQEEEENASKSA